MTMKFPGDNRMSLSADTLKALAEAELLAKFGTGIRITDISFETYPTRLRVEFTTDPDPEIVRVDSNFTGNTDNGGGGIRVEA
jgi:hypothetical protein